MALQIPDFNEKVDQKRKESLTDTQILDGLAKNSPEFSSKISTARSKYGDQKFWGGKSVANDRDLLNYLSMGYSGKMPTVPSVAIKAPHESMWSGVKNGISNVISSGLKTGLETAKGMASEEYQSLTATDPRAKIEHQIRVAGEAAKGVNELFGKALGGIANAIWQKVPQDAQKGAINEVQKLADKPYVKPVLNAISKGVDAYNSWAKKNPEAAKDVEASINLAMLFPVGELSKPISSAGESAVKTLAETSLGKQVTERVAKASEEKALGTFTEAIRPEIKGAKGSKAITQAIREGRVTPESLLTKGEVAPSSEESRLFSEFKDVIKSKSPTKNLIAVNNEMKVTESLLDELLASDKTPIIKRGLTDTLNEIKKSIPLELKSERSMRSAFYNAVEYGKKIANEAEPTMRGLRKARQAFDAKVREQFPNAFKGGVVDTKTPAGIAIKKIRDSFNEYLYNTAEEGSKIKSLIKRESDLYKLNDAIAPKATKAIKSSKVGALIKKYPKSTAAVGTAVLGAGGYEAIKKVPGIPLP